MSAKDDYRIFVGGLGWGMSEGQLESAFSRFGKIIQTQVTFSLLLLILFVLFPD
ncbi:Glycine-rich RNA-binding protein RZ1B [Linum grandiflorum]